jgi:DNA-binding PadR family transcriptional regulator
MDPDRLEGYISIVYKFSKKSPEINSGFLDILELFAWEKSLSAYQIYSKLKSTELEMAYKNVNKRIHGLELLNLIEKTEVDGEGVNKHNAKYYRLTEYGIYQLFLNKLNGLRIRELDAIKSNKPPFPNTLIFFRNYYDCLLFESILYPHFEKDTLFAIGNDLLWDLYNCLADCCYRIKECSDIYGYDISVTDSIFCWNKVPGQDNERLLLHLKELCNLESIDSCIIEKNGDTITIKTSNTAIMLKLDTNKREAIIMFNDGKGQFKFLYYNVTVYGSDILVSKQRGNDKLLSNIVYNIEKQMHQIIYDFVYHLSLSASNPEKSQEFLYYCEILSRDKKFMATVEDIYKNRHKAFETGYNMLIKDHC